MGVEETNKKSYHALSSPMTPKDIIEIFAKVTGKKAIHSPISADEFGQLAASYTGPALREDSKQMMEWAAVAPRDQVCYGAVKPGAEGVGDLGFTGSSFEDWLTRSGWTGPTEVYEPSQQVKW